MVGIALVGAGGIARRHAQAIRVFEDARIVAVVAIKPGEEMTEEEVVDHCKQHLASYKKPKSVDFIDALPRNPAGKVLKTSLRDRYGKSVKY